MMNQESFEDRYSRGGRWIRRLVRGVRWRLKGVLGLERTILVELRWRLGDEIMALPVLGALKEKFPESRISVLSNYPHILLDNPNVDVVNDEKRSPDRYILLRSGPRQENRLAHYAKCAGVAPPSLNPRVDYDDWSTGLDDELPENGERLVAVASGANWETKRWPLRRWKELCERLEGDGYDVVELGHHDEAIGIERSLMNRTQIRDAACILKQAKLFIGSDSGLMHLALAVGTPVVAMFGPTDPSIILRPRSDLRIVSNGRECQGCWNHDEEEPEPGTCPRNLAICLGTISVDMVLRAAGEFISLEH